MSTNPDETLFADALALPAAERARFLDQACAGDARQRARVAALLASQEAAANFFESPATVRAVFTPEEKPSEKIGRYKLLEKIGEGGCGVVWMAEQEEPVRRRVALKVIKLGMDTKEVIARFEAERQALAMMDHPNIAKVFDAGTTSAGRPFFVMELVRGVPITRYCDEANLSTATRLALFIDVCHAIQHAHQKGIIHRDIKPSNILVARHDDVAVPKVIDFGIAKATQGRLTDATVFTGFAQFIGTPAYMSPEQAEFSGLDVDTRSDIYSLGVLLYELLTGRPPFDPKSLQQAGLDEIRRIIREVEPARPSTRLSTLAVADRATIARLRGAAPAQLSTQLTGDLDWIVMKALEKNRTRRYESASGFAADLQRHLRHEPVAARPPSVAYALQKLVRRHRIAFAAGALVAIALTVGAVVSTWQALRATRAEAVAQHGEREQRQLRTEAQAQALTARRRTYVSDMNLVQQALAIDHLGRAKDLLDRHRPGPGEADLRGWEWRYLWQFCRSDALSTLAVKEDTAIVSLAVSPDGQWLAAGEEKYGNLTVWNLRTREEIRLPADVASVRVAFSPTGSLLAFASAGGKTSDFTSRVRLWNPDTRTIVSEIKLESYCGGLVFSADGKSLFTLVGGNPSKPAAISRWSVADGRELARHVVTNDTVTVGWSRFAIDPAEKHAAYFSSRDRKIHVLDLASGAERWSAVGADESVVSLAFSPDGKILASGSGFAESAIRLWNAATGAELGRLEGHRRFTSQLLFLDTQTLAGAGGDATIRIWDVPTRRLQHTLRGHTLELTSLALMPDRRTLVSGAKDGAIMFWNTTGTPERGGMITFPSGVAALRFSNGSDAVIALGSGNRTVVERRGKDFEEERALLEIPTANFAEFAADRPLLATVSSGGGAPPIYRVWDWQQRRLVWEKELTGTWILQFTRGGGSLLLGHQREDKSMWMQEWNLTSGQMAREWPLPFNGAAAQLSPDGKYFAAASHHGRYFYVDGGADAREELVRTELATGRSVRLPATTREMQRGASFSANGTLYAASSLRGFVDIIDVASWRRVTTLSGIMTAMHSTRFSTDGSRLVTGCSGAESVLLWDTATWSRVLTLGANKSEMRRVAFSPDGNVLGAASAAGGIFLWRAPSWAEIEAAEKK